MLLLTCPFCLHEHTDEFECLDEGRVGTIRCENPHCNKRFAFLVRECLACGEESVFTWEGLPTVPALAAFFCEHCGANPSATSQDAEDEIAAKPVQ